MSFQLRVPEKQLENSIWDLNQRDFTVSGSYRDLDGAFVLHYAKRQKVEFNSIQEEEDLPLIIEAKKSHSLKHVIFRMFMRT